MYLDTKNLTATRPTGSTLDISSSSSADASLTAVTPKAKSGKLRKVWKRLINLKSSGSGSASHGPPTTAPCHPNNVSLNNQTNSCPPPTSIGAHTTTTHTSPAYRKELSVDLAMRSFEKLTLSAADSPQGQCYREELQAIISSASIEKSTMVSSCSGCAHGRNCSRHTTLGGDMLEQQHQLTQQSDASRLHQEMLELKAEAEALIQYLSTDDGIFFWPGEAEPRIDDDLLHELLCRSYRQLPDTMTAISC